MCWPAQYSLYARLKRELREALFSSEASPECKRVAWESIARVLEEKGAEIEEKAAAH